MLAHERRETARAANVAIPHERVRDGQSADLDPLGRRNDGWGAVVRANLDFGRVGVGSNAWTFQCFGAQALDLRERSVAVTLGDAGLLRSSFCQQETCLW